MSNTSGDLPVIPEDLLKALDSIFPERCPDPSWSEREVWMRVGERRVVKFLQRVFAEQNDNVLRSHHVLEQAAQDHGR